MKTNHLELADFLLNDSFRQFVLFNTPKDAEFWNSWIKEHPCCMENFETAKEIINFIHKKKKIPSFSNLSEEVYGKLQKQLQSINPLPKPMDKKIYNIYILAAASIAIFIALFFTAKSFLLEDKRNSPSQFLEVVIAEGQKGQVILPDGTKVWLNASSKLKYPSTFLQTNREVYLEGEAFFDVTHNEDKPFTVRLKDSLTVKVLGTEFNVKCYPNEGTIEATLLKGKIKLFKADKQSLKEFDLNPNEKATYDRNYSTLKITNIAFEETKASNKLETKQEIKEKQEATIETITAWKDDALVFNDETFEEICIKMERWYGLKITLLDESIKKERFTGKFVNKETIYQVLDIFNRSEPIQYQTKNKEITISKPKKTI